MRSASQRLIQFALFSLEWRAFQESKLVSGKIFNTCNVTVERQVPRRVLFISKTYVPSFRKCKVGHFQMVCSEQKTLIGTMIVGWDLMLRNTYSFCLQKKSSDICILYTGPWYFNASVEVSGYNIRLSCLFFFIVLQTYLSYFWKCRDRWNLIYCGCILRFLENV